MSFERLSLFGSKKCACGASAGCTPFDEPAEQAARAVAEALSGGAPAALLVSRPDCRACEAFQNTWRAEVLSRRGELVVVELQHPHAAPALRHALADVRGAEALCNSVAAATPPTVVLVSRGGDHLVLRAPDAARLRSAVAAAAAVE